MKWVRQTFKKKKNWEAPISELTNVKTMLPASLIQKTKKPLPSSTLYMLEEPRARLAESVVTLVPNWI